jgi:tripartite-type tricarboxylate transporter receptor subunit TctC
MNHLTTSRRLFLAQGAACLAAPRFARAQRPSALRLMCTAPPGSIPDTVVRRYAEQLGSHYPGGVVVDNRPGAAGRLAVAALKQAEPDGSTMLLAPGAVATVFPYLYQNLTYDATTDLKPVSLAAETTLALAVGPAAPDSVTTLAQFIDWTRSNPKLANYGSPGAGTLPHLLSALLAHEAQVEWQHVPYQGGPPAVVDLLGGRLASLILPEGLLRQHHAAGKLRVLANAGSARSEFMPGVATFAEQGYPNLVMREWFAMFLPGASAPTVVESASAQIRQAAASVGVAGALREIGMLAVAGSPAQMAERIATEQRYWKRALGATGIRAE